MLNYWDFEIKSRQSEIMCWAESSSGIGPTKGTMAGDPSLQSFGLCGLNQLYIFLSIIQHPVDKHPINKLFLLIGNLASSKTEGRMCC